MKTLTFTENPLTHITNLSPLKPRIPTLHKTRTYKVHAEAKGFNSAVPPANKKEQQKRPRVEPVRRKSDETDSGNDDKEDPKIPELVFERIIRRIVAYVGIPLATGLVLLKVFDVLKEQKLWDVPLWVAFLTTFVTFGASALGIAYGTLSTSWDAEKKGSLLGFEEAQKNWVEVWREEED